MAPKALVPIYSSQVSTMDQNNSLQQENEVLRRQLLEAQELLIQRNVRLATLESEMQGLSSSSRRGSSSNNSSSNQRVARVESTATDVALNAPIASPSSFSGSLDTPAFGLLAMKQQRPRRKVIMHDNNSSRRSPHEWTRSHRQRTASNVVPTPIQETRPEITSGVDESLFQVVEAMEHSSVSDESLTIDTFLASQDDDDEFVETKKDIPTVSPSPTRETASESESSQERSNEHSVLDKDASEEDSITPSMSASNHHVRLLPAVNLLSIAVTEASNNNHDDANERPSTPVSPATTPPPRDFGEGVWASSMASESVYTTPDRKSSVYTKPPLAPTPSGRSSLSKQSPHNLPREVELDEYQGEETFQVDNVKLVDADSDEGLYSGSLSIETKLPHGRGTMVYDHRRSYTGEWRHGRWHGEGYMRCRQYEYHGEFRKDQKSGVGTLESKNGDSYHGDFVNDLKHGNGKQVYADGSVYEGNWVDNVKSGKGSLHNADGSHYFGFFFNDLYHGQGKLTYEDGSLYFGQFKKGQKSGHGLALRADGSTLHEGLWMNDEPIRGYDIKRMEKLQFSSTMREI